MEKSDTHLDVNEMGFDSHNQEFDWFTVLVTVMIDNPLKISDDSVCCWILNFVRFQYII